MAIRRRPSLAVVPATVIMPCTGGQPSSLQKKLPQVVAELTWGHNIRLIEKLERAEEEAMTGINARQMPATLRQQMAEGRKLDAAIEANLKELGCGG
ncbi:MAG: hypothetical protein ACRERD_28455 [Candidatus Binatia bacterium]